MSPTVPATSPRVLRATLPAPPGVNATYRTGAGRFYKSERAEQWSQDAVARLRAAGFRSQPAGLSWLGVSLSLFTTRLDCDAPVKIVIDAISTALGIDDRQVGRLTVVKVRVPTAAQRLEVSVEIVPVQDKDAWNALSARRGACRDEHELTERLLAEMGTPVEIEAPDEALLDELLREGTADLEELLRDLPDG